MNVLYFKHEVFPYKEVDNNTSSDLTMIQKEVEKIEYDQALFLRILHILGYKGIRSRIVQKDNKRRGSTLR